MPRGFYRCFSKVDKKRIQWGENFFFLQRYFLIRSAHKCTSVNFEGMNLSLCDNTKNIYWFVNSLFCMMMWHRILSLWVIRNQICVEEFLITIRFNSRMRGNLLLVDISILFLEWIKIDWIIKGLNEGFTHFEEI